MKSDDDYVMSKLPRRLVDRLMPFQKDGIKFVVKKHGRCLIADEMGLGKTIQAISVAYYYQSEWPLLIIVPSSLKYCWIEELEKWLPGIHPHEINLIRAGNDASDISSAQITIVTYGLLSKQTSTIVHEALMNQHFKVVICDESHYIRNSRTASCKAVVPLIKNACRRILLSGTPALSKPVELFPQIDAVKPGGFGSWWQFTSRYCDARMEWVGRQKLRKVDGASNLEELQSRLCSSVMIRREKKDVLTQLPPKQRQKVLFELKDSSQKKDILNLFEELKPMLRKSSPAASLSLEAATEITDQKNNKESLQRLSLISKLYQLSGEAKIGPVKEYLEMLCDNSSLKFLVFAYHHVMMNGIQQTLYEKKVKFIRIDGETKQEDRLLYVQQFQSDPDTKVAILSILAAGVGLTFTAAKLVVFAEMYWTPGVMIQCEDRAHRIGQTANLPVHYLVAKGTMDEWVWGAVCRKTVVTSTALSGERRKLEADQGDRYQVDLLSNADAWVPKEQTDIDFQTYFQSQKSNDQRSILEFFTPPSSKNKSGKPHDASGQKRQREETNTLSSCKKQKTGSKVECVERILEEVVVLDSDEEEEEFRDEKTQKKRRKNVQRMKQDSDLDTDCHNTVFTPLRNRSTSSVGFCVSDLLDGTLSSSPCAKNTFFKLQGSSQDIKTKADVVQSTDKSMSQWSCSACTFLNHSYLHRCEMCDTPSKNKKLTSGGKKSPNSHSSKHEGGRNLSDWNDIQNVLTSSDGSMSNNETDSTDSDCLSHCKNMSKAQNNQESLENEAGDFQSPVFGKKLKSLALATMEEERSEDSLCVFSDVPEKNGQMKNLDLVETSDVSTSIICYKEINSTDRKQTMSQNEKPDNNLIQQEYCPSTRVSFTVGEGKTGDHVTRSSKHGQQVSNDHSLVSSPVQSCILETQSEDSTSDDDLLVSSSGTPAFKKRKCFQMGSDSEEESQSDETQKDTPRRLCNPVSIHSPIKTDKEFTVDAAEKETPVRCSKMLHLTDDSSSGCKTVDECTPCDAEPLMMSTPAGQKYECTASSWELLPCDSPCFNLELESSSDGSHENGLTFGGSRSSVLCNPKQDSSETDLGERCDQTSAHIGDKELVLDNELLPVLVTPRRRKSGSKSETTPQKVTEFVNSNKVPVCAEPLLKNMSSRRESETAVKPVDPERAEVNVRRRGAYGEADRLPSSAPLQTPCDNQETTTPGKKLSPHGPIKPSKDGNSQSFFPSFLYCVSFYTGRVYLFHENGDPLNENFLPLDVEMGNLDQLPVVLHHPSNLRVVQKFVREWNSLTETKKRLIVKQGMMFSSPLVAYNEVRSGKVLSTQRHKTKDDVNSEAVKMAATLKGTVRLITKRGQTGSQQSHDQTKQMQDDPGVLQAVTPDGIPLCLNCQSPYENSLLQKSTITDANNAWNTRFCSRQCMDKYWMQTHSSYCREKVYEVEHGICQICRFDAHSFYKQIRDIPDLGKRAKRLGECKFSRLKAKQKEAIVRKPVEGQFWHVDHIIPVWEGGGMCDIDNMRTLCVICHQKVTAGQARKRAVVRRLQGAAAGADITAFFQRS